MCILKTTGQGTYVVQYVLYCGELVDEFYFTLLHCSANRWNTDLKVLREFVQNARDWDIGHFGQAFLT
jgi:hypothetical protein